MCSYVLATSTNLVHRHMASRGEVGEALANEDRKPGLSVENSFRRVEWYAVQTLYRYEQRIARDLTAKGFETYLPLLRETRQWTDRKKIIHVPAFGGYIFVHQEASLHNRVRVLETSGVVRILGDNHSPVAIPEIEIQSLRRMLESDASCRKCEYLTVGTMVEVKRGALTGIRGRLVRIHNSLRLVLSVATVSQAISVEVGLEDVELVAGSEGKNHGEIDRDVSGVVPIRQLCQCCSDPSSVGV
jgi:transcription antitermination factor NusG